MKCSTFCIGLQATLLLVIIHHSSLIRGNNGNRHGTSFNLSRDRPRRHRQRKSEMELWIDQKQVRLLSGYPMEIQIVAEGRVLPYILAPNFDKYLPNIPSDVNSVNFTWRSGPKKYFYQFDKLISHQEEILHPPAISVDLKGRIPRKPKTFSIQIKCSGNGSGIATFSIGLTILKASPDAKKGRPIPGTPIRLKLRKQCINSSPDVNCDKKCSNGGICDPSGICKCPEGYLGQFCHQAMCFPQCENNGTCIRPGVCQCQDGFHGLHCEGGICARSCQNGGKCIQKDTCHCTNGYFGHICEFSKCMIKCKNDGICTGVNICRCHEGFYGRHCEIRNPGRHLSQRHLKCTRRKKCPGQRRKLRVR